MWKPTCPEPEPEPASPSAALSLPSPRTPPPTHKKGRDPYSTQQNWRTLYLAQLHRKENGKKMDAIPILRCKTGKIHILRGLTAPQCPKWLRSFPFAAKKDKILILRGLHAPNSASRRSAVLIASRFRETPGYLIRIWYLLSIQSGQTMLRKRSGRHKPLKHANS